MAVHPLASNVKFLAHFDGNFADEKGHTFSTTGSFTTAGTPKYGSGAAQATISTSIGINTHADFYLATGTDFEWEASIKFDTPSFNTSFALRVIDFCGFQIGVYYTGTQYAHYLNVADGGWTRVDLPTIAMQSGAYHNYYLSRASGTVRLFIDGSLAGKYVGSTASATGFNAYLYAYTSTGMTFTLDEWCVVVGAAQHTTDSSFSPPSSAYSLDNVISGAIGSAGAAVVDFSTASLKPADMGASAGAFALFGSEASLIFPAAFAMSGAAATALDAGQVVSGELSGVGVANTAIAAGRVVPAQLASVGAGQWAADGGAVCTATAEAAGSGVVVMGGTAVVAGNMAASAAGGAAFDGLATAYETIAAAFAGSAASVSDWAAAALHLSAVTVSAAANADFPAQATAGAQASMTASSTADVAGRAIGTASALMGGRGDTAFIYYPVSNAAWADAVVFARQRRRDIFVRG